MTSVLISIAVSACVFAGAMIGLHLHRVLPKHNLNKETQEVVRLGIGMLSVLASLVIGLLIATAKTSYDATQHNIQSYAANLLLLNETFRDYGEAARPPRDLLRQHTAAVLHDIWNAPDAGPHLDGIRAGALLEAVRSSVRALKPVDAGQSWLQEQALKINVALLHDRWMLIEGYGPSIQPLLLEVLVAWISVIFASFGLNAPRNMTVVASFLVSSLAIGGAIFLIQEMDSPLTGMMKISAAPMRTALAQMNW